jgi:hypothetical protein
MRHVQVELVFVVLCASWRVVWYSCCFAHYYCACSLEIALLVCVVHSQTSARTLTHTFIHADGNVGVIIMEEDAT